MNVVPMFGDGDDGGNEITDESEMVSATHIATAMVADIAEQCGGTASWSGSFVVDGATFEVDISVSRSE